MATGDILSCTIRADGWSADVVVEGFTTGATYDFGSLGALPATVATPKFTLSVVSEGYTNGVLGTINRTIYGTEVIRKPTPDQASLDETGGGNLTVRVGLSDPVYNDDKNGGAGTSGTNPTVTISAGWCVNSGGGAQSSAAASALACTNNSTLDYPKTVAQWAWYHTPAFERVESDFSIGAVVFAGFGIDQVTLSATGDVSAAVVSGSTSTRTKHLATASQLYYESYDLAVPVAGFTQAENITLRYIAYPRVGDADSVLDTATRTAEDDVALGWAQIKVTCDKTLALRDYAIIDPVGGNDTTGAKSTVLATAEATPYLTIGKALASGATLLYVKTGGTPDILGSTPVSVAAKDYAIEVRPYPGDTVTLTRLGTWTTYKATRLLYHGFTISYASGNGWLDGNNAAAAILKFRNITFSTTATPTVGLGYQSRACFFLNCSGMGTDFYRDFGGARIRYSLAGCDASSGCILGPVYGAVACSFDGTTAADTNRFIERTNSANQPVQNNFIWAWNKLTNGIVSGQEFFKLGFNANLQGVAIIGNLFEVKTITASQPAFWIGADSSATTLDSVIVAHNTVAGERTNFCYNDVGVAAVNRSNVFLRNNAFQAYNIKSDTFGTPNAARIGNWAQLYGVGYSDNRYDGGLFPNDYYGINVDFVTAVNTTFGQLGYTLDKSSDGTGAGNGDYLPAVGSVLRGHTLRQSYLSFDMLGNPINQEIGAFQVLAAVGGAPGLSKGIGFALAIGF